MKQVQRVPLLKFPLFFALPSSSGRGIGDVVDCRDNFFCEVWVFNVMPSILDPVKDPDFSGDESSKAYRKNWARLIQKIYALDPLTCTKCQGKMCLIALIEE
jgi:hypothetical protein